jgi:SAM-dependent MidA family methyltransferase
MTWSEAVRQALYGHGGFFHRPEGPAGHFRTSVHTSPAFAAAVLRLLAQVDVLLGEPARLDLVDVGAGRGELLLALRTMASTTSLAGRLRLHAVELADRPRQLPDEVGWTAEPPEAVTGLVVANEWLDDVPVDVVEVGVDGVHRVLVDPATGHESPGGPVGLRDAAWLRRWWPLDGAEPGSRAEVGTARDEAWAQVVGSLARGVAVAVDYGHLRAERAAGAYAAGTLVGYRDGRAVPPVPDGSCDVTAHVAVDACADAGTGAGAEHTALGRQRDVLGQLGVDGSLPAVQLARSDPLAYAQALADANAAAQLLARDGLGAFWWLAQSVGVALPAALAG